MNGKVKLIAVAALEYRMAVFWFILFSVNSLCSAIVLSMEGKDWSVLTKWQKFIIVVMVLMNWTNLLMAYISKASQRIKQDPDLPLEVDTPQKPSEIAPTAPKQ